MGRFIINNSYWETNLHNVTIMNYLNNLHTTLSSMECKSCSGNVDPETLKCTCCGRQYRLVAEND